MAWHLARRQAYPGLSQLLTALPMNPQTEIDLLRSQLADARKQLEADSQTIAESAELLNAIILWLEADMRQAPPNAESMAAFFLPTFCKNAHNFLSRHA